MERSAEEIVGASASGEMPLLLSFALRSGGEMLQAISAPHSAQEYVPSRFGLVFRVRFLVSCPDWRGRSSAPTLMREKL